MVTMIKLKLQLLHLSLLLQYLEILLLRKHLIYTSRIVVSKRKVFLSAILIVRYLTLIFCKLCINVFVINELNFHTSQLIKIK